MKEMERNKREILASHMREKKAKAKSKSFASMVSRIRMEQEFRKILNDLKTDQLFWQEIYPKISEEVEKVEFSPDFIVWRGDIKIPIFLSEYKKKRGFSISKEALLGLFNFMRQTDSSRLAIVWMNSPSFPSKVLKIESLNEKLATAEEVSTFEGVSPFREEILDSIEKMATRLPRPKYDISLEPEKPERLLEMILGSIHDTLKLERKRKRPHLEYRKQALTSISERDLEKVVLLVERYLKGELSDNKITNEIRKMIQDSKRLMEEQL